jgi:hypothetical protein
MEFSELPIYKVKKELISGKLGQKSYCRACKKTEDSSELFSFRFCESWVQEIFETLGGFSVSLNMNF